MQPILMVIVVAHVRRLYAEEIVSVPLHPILLRIPLTFVDFNSVLIVLIFLLPSCISRSGGQ